MLRPSPKHRTLRLLNDNDDDIFRTENYVLASVTGGLAAAWPRSHVNSAFVHKTPHLLRVNINIDYALALRFL